MGRGGPGGRPAAGSGHGKHALSGQLSMRPAGLQQQVDSEVRAATAYLAGLRHGQEQRHRPALCHQAGWGGGEAATQCSGVSACLTSHLLAGRRKRGEERARMDRQRAEMRELLHSELLTQKDKLAAEGAAAKVGCGRPALLPRQPAS